MKPYAIPAAALALAAAATGVLALKPTPAVSAPKAYKVIDTKDCGAIRGTCRIKEAVPVWKVTVQKDNDKGCGEKERDTERLLYDPATRGLANCLVHLKAIDAGKAWPEEMSKEERTAVVDQKGCRYVPHVQWVRPQTQMVVLNSDQAEHNIHGYKNTMSVTQFNFASQPGTKNDDTEAAFLETPGLYILKCDIHAWMSAYIRVVDHPYHAVTKAAAEGDVKPGEFLLTDVPPGTYTLVAWHEGMEETPVILDGKIATYTYSADLVREAEVKVESGKTATVDFEFEKK